MIPAEEIPDNPSFERFQTVCRDAGLKLTPQRLEIYNELAIARDHPSAEDIFHRVRRRMPTIALDTVYRTLTTFESIGAIARVDVADDRARFDAELGPHHHCVCTRCRSIKDFQWETFDIMGMPKETGAWGRLMDKQVVLRGVCRECLRKEADAEG